MVHNGLREIEKSHWAVLYQCLCTVICTTIYIILILLLLGIWHYLHVVHIVISLQLFYIRHVLIRYSKIVHCTIHTQFETCGGVILVSVAPIMKEMKTKFYFTAPVIYSACQLLKHKFKIYYYLFVCSNTSNHPITENRFYHFGILF